MIKYVDILETNYSGDQTSILRFSVDTEDEDQNIKIENLNGFKGDYKNFLEDGEFIVGKNAIKHSVKESGMLFLKNLIYEFKGSMIRATDVKILEA